MGATIDEIIDSLKRGQGKRVSDLVKMALEEGTDPQMILEDGFLAGMEQVADKFRKEEVGVPEILSVTRALERGVSTLRHYSGGRAKKEIGTVIIGTVKGDLHDIGKNLVKIMMESKNIRVIDLGVDVSPRRFLEEAVGSHAQIVCLSGIMPHSEDDTFLSLNKKEVLELIDLIEESPILKDGDSLSNYGVKENTQEKYAKICIVYKNNHGEVQNVWLTYYIFAILQEKIIE